MAKLENDILYLFTPVETRADLAEALHITRALRAVADLQEPLPETLAGLESPALLRAWMCVRTLRGIAAKLCRDDRNPVQLAVALLRYAVHTLGFEEASPLQREWALAGACGYAADVEDMTIADESPCIDWVDSADLALPGRIGITICPGRRDRRRDLEADVAALAAAGVSKVLCLLSDAELEWAGALALGERVRAAGLDVSSSWTRASSELREPSVALGTFRSRTPLSALQEPLVRSPVDRVGGRAIRPRQRPSG